MVLARRSLPGYLCSLYVRGVLAVFRETGGDLQSGSLVKVVLLLCVSNVFMLSAWYFHLRQWQDKPWYFAAFLSWGIAFFEYAVHIPANRLGSTVLSLPQLQILQVGLSLLYFMPFAAFVMRRPVSLDYLLASACAAFFIFRDAAGRKAMHPAPPQLEAPPIPEPAGTTAGPAATAITRMTGRVPLPARSAVSKRT